jgi:hypothetical protein
MNESAYAYFSKKSNIPKFELTKGWFCPETEQVSRAFHRPIPGRGANSPVFQQIGQTVVQHYNIRLGDLAWSWVKIHGGGMRAGVEEGQRSVRKWDWVCLVILSFGE